MKRVLLFAATNIAVLAVISVVMRLFGFDHYLTENGLDYRALAVFSLLWGTVGSFISLALSKTIAKKSMGVQVIENPATEDERWLLETVRRQTQEVGIGMPEVGVFQSPSPNAFATGMKKNDALVAVSTGLLQTMSKDEVEAVLGHEVAHVANGDMITLTLIQGVLNAFVIFFSRIIGYAMSAASRGNSGGYRSGSFIGTMIAQVVLGFLASMIVSWFSRWREFHADKGGARLAGNQKMINALKALQGSSRTEPLKGEFAAFGISSGGRGQLAKLFSTHPPLEDRIAALEKAQYGDNTVVK